MAQAMHAEILAYEQEIHNSRARALDAFCGLIDRLDESTQWPEIIRKARDAGLDKATLVAELSCAWSTILRWEAGDTAPGAFARRAIKGRLLELLAQLKSRELEHIAEREPEVA